MFHLPERCQDRNGAAVNLLATDGTNHGEQFPITIALPYAPSPGLIPRPFLRRVNYFVRVSSV